MSSQRDDERDYPTSRASIAALPSFKPIRNESGPSIKAVSSASGSRRGSSHSPYEREHKTPDRTSNGNAVNEKGLDRTSRAISKRTSQRRSGGFLIDQTFPGSRLSQKFLSRSHNSQKDVKGKRKSDGSELVFPKRRVLDAREAHRSSVGSSPLAQEVRAPRDFDASFANGGPAAPKNAQTSATSQSSSNHADHEEHGSIANTAQTLRPSVGYDSDPAQIVNMALSLSEGRRRQVSGMRVISGPTGGKRSASGLAPPGSHTTHSGSLEQYLTPQRQGSRNISPRLSVVPAKLNGSMPISNIPFSHSMNGVEGNQREQEISLSQATVKRIQKAKNYFELAYEHRRLLSHLPPLRTPDSTTVSPEYVEQSKVYNPLQYVRNRKLRFREKCPIAAEDEGWHDILQVRTWVDAVISSHTETRHNPDECVRLPELARHEALTAEEEDEVMKFEAAESGNRQASGQPVKPKRPRSDWETHPGDFIADAFWLEQGLNKTKIEDANGNPIYSPDTNFKFSGWRNRAPVNLPSDFQEHTLPPEKTDDFGAGEIAHPRVLPNLPTFRSTQNDKKSRKDRGRRKDKLLDSVTKNGSGSRRRPPNIFGDFDYSSGSPTASDSDVEVERRGRKRDPRKLRKNFSIRESSGRNRRKRTTGDEGQSHVSADQSQNQFNATSKRGSLDSSRISKLFTRDSTKAYHSLNPSHSRSDSTRQDSAKPRISQDSERMPPSSAEYDTTAPNSPTGPEWPSIAINLSPPQSRSPSPTKKPLQSRLNPFRDRSKQREGISATDFAQKGLTPNASMEVDTKEDSSRGTSPMTRGTSPLTKIAPADNAVEETHYAASDHRDSTVSRVSTRSAAPSEGPGKVRGIFKGGRIAELVGNEVSRVGDFIWKRDAPITYRPRMSASSTSIKSHHESDTDDEHWQNGNVYKTSLPQHHKRHPSHISTESERRSPTISKSSPSSAEKPQYHNPNLPVFTSPFQRDKETQDEIKRTHLNVTDSVDDHDHDHISRLAAQHRSSSKSPRLDRLAPPRLDTSRPSSPPGIRLNSDRRNSYGFGNVLDLSKSRNASQIFNSALDDKPEGFPATGLAKLKASHSGVNMSRSWNTSRQSLLEADSITITRQDIARAAALLISSAVKAQEIALRSDTPRIPPPKFLLDTMDPSNEALHSRRPYRVKRREEHVVAARNLITTLTSQAYQFQSHLRAFSTTTTPHLHTELQTLEDMVDNTMTPRVRGAADQAGELSMKLTTTSTLAVKALNDSISSALRRRRKGPVRWLRRLGYKVIEVGVVGLLWGIWLVVTLLHSMLTVIMGILKAVRWLFWLN